MLVLFAALLEATALAAEPEGLSLNHGAQVPWWIAETALTASGGLRLDEKAWWDKASKLEVGGSFLTEDGAGLVRREVFEDARGKEQDAIVWVIDDDRDGLSEGGDKDSDCYVVDYGRDGTVDRMVDYIDDDGDNDPDEMDIRYFVDGELRYCWFGVDYDDDSAMWSLRGYEYGGPSFFESDPHGDNMIYMNKLDTDSGEWAPISECPFAFYDTDADGFSEIAIRCSAVPLSYDSNADPDYANDYGNFAAPWNPALSRMGIVNLRYSFDIDGGSSEATPLHYDFGFNLVGAVPYEYPGMRHYNPKRRPPQTTVVTPFKDLRAISDSYPARETGFSWHEERDDTISIGHGPNADDDFRWEGVFWTWERRFMENTGGPNQKWNVRREYSATPTERRELYYSAIDRRIHLKGASEGWIQIGHFNGLGELGEIRMFDTDRNGYFDRWEYDLGEERRVVTVRDEGVEDLPWDMEALSKRYVAQILPEAVAANARFIEAISSVHPYAPDPKLAAAASGEPGTYQRYAQDILRELQYADFRAYWSTRISDAIRALPMDDLRPLDAKNRALGKTSQNAWELRRVLTEIDVLYGQGRLEEAGQNIAASKNIFAILGSESVVGK
jgi:hypothetical protein